MMYQPSSSPLERLRSLFQRRVKDGSLAYIGDGNGKTDVPGKDGYVYVRFSEGKNLNGTPKLGGLTTARATGVAFPNYDGSPVYVGYKYNNELEIVSAHYGFLDKIGINTSALNPLNQQSKFVYLWQLTMGLANAVATTTTPSTRVMVKSFRHYVADIFATFDTPLAADKIDLAAYIPAVDQHCYAAVWIDTYTNLPVVTTSIAQAMTTPLNETDLQELIVRTASSRPADGIPLKAFYLANDQTTLVSNVLDVDLRQVINNPLAWGFPHALTTLERVRPGRTLVVGPYTATGVGALTIESGGRVLNVHKSNVAASDPTVNDDSGDGYDVGSTWFNSSTNLWYVLTNATVGAAVWEAVAGSGAGTVTSVGLTMPTGVFDVAGSPVTTAGTLAVTLDNQSANTVFAGPTSGGATTPTFRAVVSDDINAALLTPGPIGTTTPNSGYFSALRLFIGSFFAIFTHANSADRTYTLQNASGTLAFLTDIPTPENVTIDWQYFDTTGFPFPEWTKPAGCYLVHVICVGAGGGGGSGMRGASLSNRFGGGGGAAGFVTDKWFEASELDTVETITIGAGGTGGTAIVVNTTVGNNGTGGNPSTFGGDGSFITAKLFAYGGNGGAGGQGSPTAGGTGCTTLGAMFQYYGSDGGAGGTGAGVGLTGVGAVIGAWGPSGGGGGGGLDTGNTARNGGNGGSHIPVAFGDPIGTGGSGGGTTGAAGGTANGGAASLGAAGAAGTTDGTSALLFGGGAGGGAPNTNVGCAGGGGGGPGGGGGGGSSSLNGNASGAGGNGADGGVFVISYIWS